MKYRVIREDIPSHANRIMLRMFALRAHMILNTCTSTLSLVIWFGLILNVPFNLNKYLNRWFTPTSMKQRNFCMSEIGPIVLFWHQDGHDTVVYPIYRTLTCWRWQERRRPSLELQTTCGWMAWTWCAPSWPDRASCCRPAPYSYSRSTARPQVHRRWSTDGPRSYPSVTIQRNVA